MFANDRNQLLADASFSAVLAFSQRIGEIATNRQQPTVSLLVGLMHDRNRPEYGYDFDELLQEARTQFESQSAETVNG